MKLCNTYTVSRIHLIRVERHTKAQHDEIVVKCNKTTDTKGGFCSHGLTLTLDITKKTFHPMFSQPIKSTGLI